MTAEAREDASPPAHDQPSIAVSDVDVIHAAIPRLRRSVDKLDQPDDGPTRSLSELRIEVLRASDDRLQARYADLARGLPDLLVELARAGQIRHAAGKRNAAGLLTLALRSADGVAFKFGYHDLSARLIDLMRQAAQNAEDALLLAAVAYVRTETFFATGDLDTAARAQGHVKFALCDHSLHRVTFGEGVCCRTLELAFRTVWHPETPVSGSKIAKNATKSCRSGPKVHDYVAFSVILKGCRR